AEPVYRRALDDRFWSETSQEEAAFVYGTAARFATVDPLARMAARRCEQEARDRWGVDLRPGDSQHASDQPVTSEDVDEETVEAVAPAVDGEEARDWSQALDESAASNRAETASGDGAEQEAREAETSLSALAAVVEQTPEVAQVRATSTGDGSVQFVALDDDGRELADASGRLNAAQAAATTPALIASRMGGKSLSRDDFMREASTPLMRVATKPRPDAQHEEDADTMADDHVARDVEREVLLSADAAAEQSAAATHVAPEEQAASREYWGDPATLAEFEEHRRERAAATAAAARLSAWDTQAAREAWEAEKLRAGLPAEAVRAAKTGDLALHEPPAMATAEAPSLTSGRRPPAPKQGREHTLTR
ncbi:hypothetical protein, partial [Actinomyces succiniciruminis]